MRNYFVSYEFSANGKSGVANCTVEVPRKIKNKQDVISLLEKVFKLSKKNDADNITGVVVLNYQLI